MSFSVFAWSLSFWKRFLSAFPVMRAEVPNIPVIKARPSGSATCACARRVDLNASSRMLVFSHSTKRRPRSVLPSSSPDESVDVSANAAAERALRVPLTHRRQI